MSATNPTTVETVAVVLCAECHFENANENPDPQYTSNASCEACFADDVECDHDGYALVDFSNTPCAKCETTLAGSRHHYAYWPTAAELAEDAAMVRDLQINAACRSTLALLDSVHTTEISRADAAKLRQTLWVQTAEVLDGPAEPDTYNIGAALAAINSDVPTIQAITCRWNGGSHGASRYLARQGDLEIAQGLLTVPATGIPEMRDLKPASAKITPEEAVRIRSRINMLEVAAQGTHLVAGPRYLRAALANILGTDPSEVAALAELALKANNHHVLSALLQMSASRAAYEGAHP